MRPPTLRTYSSCTPGGHGGVTTLALNTDRTAAAKIRLAGLGAIGAGIYRVTGELGSEQVALNGRPLALDANDRLPRLSPARVEGRDRDPGARLLRLHHSAAGAVARLLQALSQRFGFSTII